MTNDRPNSPRVAALTTSGIRVAYAVSMINGAFWFGAWLSGYAAHWSAAGASILKTNMALCQLLAGIALMLLAPATAGRAQRNVGAALALVIMAVGALTLCEHLFGVNLHIDQLLAHEGLHPVATASPNRMGPPGALCLTLLAVGLLALARNRRRLAPPFGLAVCIVSLVPAIGFLYGVVDFYSLPGVTDISWPTVVVLLVMGGGLILTQHDSGPVAMMLRNDPGGVLMRRLLPPAVLIPLVLGYFRLEGERVGLFDAPTGTGTVMIILILLMATLVSRSARSLSRAETRRRASETQLRTLTEVMEHAFEPLIVWEPNGVIRAWNRGAEALYGWTATEALGQRMHALLATDSRQVEQFSRELEQTGRWEGELVHATRFGRRVTVESRQTASRSGNGSIYILESNRDVTARKQAEEALGLSENRYRGLFNTLLEGFCIVDVLFDANGSATDFRFLEINPAFENQTGLVAAKGRRMRELSPNHNAYWFELCGNVARTGEPARFAGDAKAFGRDYDGCAFRIGGAGSRQVAMLFNDITEQRRAEEQLKASLLEKDVLLREIHHRVKNNLQIISSLVRLQADNLVDERLRAVFGDVRDRVHTMALVHEMLYQTHNLARVNFADYAANLLRYLWRTHGELASRVELNLALAPMLLPAEAAIQCGLILNELTSNALKHAFPIGSSGTLTIRLDHDAATGQARLVVRDDGAGLPPALDVRQSRTLGLQLVHLLANQLHGSVELGHGPGTEFRVRFALAKEESH